MVRSVSIFIGFPWTCLIPARRVLILLVAPGAIAKVIVVHQIRDCVLLALLTQVPLEHIMGLPHLCAELGHRIAVSLAECGKLLQHLRALLRVMLDLRQVIPHVLVKGQHALVALLTLVPVENRRRIRVLVRVPLQLLLLDYHRVLVQVVRLERHVDLGVVRGLLVGQEALAFAGSFQIVLGDRSLRISSLVRNVKVDILVLVYPYWGRALLLAFHRAEVAVARRRYIALPVVLLVGTLRGEGSQVLEIVRSCTAVIWLPMIGTVLFYLKV